MAVIHRAVLCFDAAGAVRILATDSALIASDIAETGCGTDAGDIGIVRPREVGPGLNLWTGTAKLVMHGAEADEEIVYIGKATPILNMAEALELLTMAPPGPIEEDDRDPTGT